MAVQVQHTRGLQPTGEVAPESEETSSGPGKGWPHASGCTLGDSLLPLGYLEATAMCMPESVPRDRGTPHITVPFDLLLALTLVETRVHFSFIERARVLRSLARLFATHHLAHPAWTDVDMSIFSRDTSASPYC